MPWDSQGNKERPKSRDSTHRALQRDGRESQLPSREKDGKESQRERIERYRSTSHQQHVRNESNATGQGSSGDYGESQLHNRSNSNGGRRHDYDVQSMETAISSPRTSLTKNPIPAPTVTVRSEYPTLSRSRQQQSLTCLITVEVPEGKWSPDPADLRGVVPLPSTQPDDGFTQRKSPDLDHPGDWSSESPEVLEEITEDLRLRVDNWHGLDFQRYEEGVFFKSLCTKQPTNNRSLIMTGLENYAFIVRCG